MMVLVHEIFCDGGISVYTTRCCELFEMYLKHFSPYITIVTMQQWLQFDK